MSQSLESSGSPPASSEQPFRLTELASVDPTFAGRREVKYLVEAANVDLARELMESRFERAVFNRPVSTVRSIYFDTHQLSTCYANLKGVGRRHKARLRWYDQELPDKDVYFEVKWRRNQVTGKFRSPLALQRPLKDISYQQLREGLAAALPENSRVYAQLYDQPVVLVQYHREHFVCRDLGLRMTLDYDLVFYDMSGQVRPALGFGVPMPSLALIEAKSVPPAPANLSRLLQPVAKRASRCSKYVHGCAQVGRISPTAVW